MEKQNQDPLAILQDYLNQCAADGIELQQPEPVVFTTANTGVSEIFEDLINSIKNANNLNLSPPKLK